MPKPVRRISSTDVNQALRDPALVTVSRDFRRAYVSLLRSMDTVRPWRGGEGD